MSSLRALPAIIVIFLFFNVSGLLFGLPAVRFEFSYITAPVCSSTSTASCLVQTSVSVVSSLTPPVVPSVRGGYQSPRSTTITISLPNGKTTTASVDPNIAANHFMAGSIATLVSYQGQNMRLEQGSALANVASPADPLQSFGFILLAMALCLDLSVTGYYLWHLLLWVMRFGAKQFGVVLPMDRVPEPGLGLRGWQVVEIEENHKVRLGLRALIQESPVYLGTPIQVRAECLQGHPSPAKNCNCGLYSAKAIEGVIIHGAHVEVCSHCVVGIVAYSGRLQKFHNGIRAERHRIVALIDRSCGHLVDFTTQALATQLSIPLVSMQNPVEEAYVLEMGFSAS